MHEWRPLIFFFFKWLRGKTVFQQEFIYSIYGNLLEVLKKNDSGL